MVVIRRCLVHSVRPDRVVEPAKEMVARGAEILAVGDTASALAGAGVPLSDVPPLTSTSNAPHDAFQLLDPRIHAGLLGDWNDREQRAELESKGVKRIDMVLVELPGPPSAERGSPDRLSQLDIGGAAVLRSAARNHRSVTVVCNLADFPAVLRELDGRAGRVGIERRRHLARKALLAVARYDTVQAVSSPSSREVPDAWSVQLVRQHRLPLDAGSRRVVGLFGEPTAVDDPHKLELLSGPALTPTALLDAERAWSLVVDRGDPAVVICHRGGLCGFSLAGDGGLHRAFARARAADPGGAFGAVAAFNREVDSKSAAELSAAFLQAVLAPAFDAEARAVLGRTKTRLLQAGAVGRPLPTCRTTAWGLLLDWSDPGASRLGARCIVSQRQPDEDELAGLELAWDLVSRLRPVAVVVATRWQMLAAGEAQTNLRDAARVAVMKRPAGVPKAVAACGSPIRFADDVALLADAGITAIAHPAGSPRQAELVARADRLGLAMQVVEQDAGGTD